jgi:hypothetical protein
MAAILSSEGFRFLFRTDKGTVSRDVWWFGTTLISTIVLSFQIVWLLVSPYATSDLSQRGLFDAAALGVYSFLIVYAFVAFLSGVCWYNLSAKRFRDRGLAPSFAGLPMVLALLAGAAHWLAPRMPEMVPAFVPSTLDIALVLVILWCVFELGLRPAAKVS